MLIFIATIIWPNPLALGFSIINLAPMVTLCFMPGNYTARLCNYYWQLFVLGLLIVLLFYSFVTLNDLIMEVCTTAITNKQEWSGTDADKCLTESR